MIRTIHFFITVWLNLLLVQICKITYRQSSEPKQTIKSKHLNDRECKSKHKSEAVLTCCHTEILLNRFIPTLNIVKSPRNSDYKINMTLNFMIQSHFYINFPRKKLRCNNGIILNDIYVFCFV